MKKLPGFLFMFTIVSTSIIFITCLSVLTFDIINDTNQSPNVNLIDKIISITESFIEIDIKFEGLDEVDFPKQTTSTP